MVWGEGDVCRKVGWADNRDGWVWKNGVVREGDEWFVVECVLFGLFFGEGEEGLFDEMVK